MRSKTLFAAILGIIMAPGCVDSKLDESRQEIIGGDMVVEGELPTVGGISTNAGSVCTGTLISPTAVLTAAHCVEPNLLKQAMEQAGQTPPDEIVYRFSFARDLTAASEDDLLEVASVEWHDEFLMDFSGLLERPGKWHDIAIMHLAEPVRDRPVQQLAPADVVETLEMGRDYLVAGYGLTDDSDPMSAGSLMQGRSGLDERGQFELIAGVGDAQQACRGDSGGPIFADDSDTYQIGVASRINADLIPPPSSPPPCETGLLYTRVDAYLSWIEERVEDLGEGADPSDPEDPNDPDGEGMGKGDSGGGCAVAAGSSAGDLGGLLLVWLSAMAVNRAIRRRFPARGGRRSG